MYGIDTMERYWNSFMVFVFVGAAVMALLLAAVVFTVIGRWRVFAKLRRRPWTALIPCLSDYEICRGANAPRWLAIVYPAAKLTALVLLALTGMGIFTGLCSLVAFALHCAMCCYVSVKFGKTFGWVIGLALVGIIFWPILGIGDSSPVGDNHPIKSPVISKT